MKRICSICAEQLSVRSISTGPNKDHVLHVCGDKDCKKLASDFRKVLIEARKDAENAFFSRPVDDTNLELQREYAAMDYFERRTLRRLKRAS